VSGLERKTVKGILADIHLKGPVEDLVREMQAEPWAEFWNELGLVLFHFEDVRLTPTSTDLEIWQRCQAEDLILITSNRNSDSPESLEASIRRFNTANCLPVFTIGDLDNFRKRPDDAPVHLESHAMSKERLKHANRRLTEEERARHAQIREAAVQDIPPKAGSIRSHRRQEFPQRSVRRGRTRAHLVEASASQDQGNASTVETISTITR